MPDRIRLDGRVAVVTGAAGVIGTATIRLLAERGWHRSLLSLVVAMFLGHAVIFVFGTAWLGALIGYEKAWALGVAPFYLATVFKTVLAAACIKAGWSAANLRG